MKVVTVVGARPQFIKAAAVSRAVKSDPGLGVQELILHTGQHFDENMSDIFFEELDIPRPDFHLSISGGTHGTMTGRMLEAIEEVLLNVRPDAVLIYGDTNSTLAGALAATKLHIPVAHVEAGLRSFNMRMPEEVNRVLADRVSTLLFCPTDTAVRNLDSEGIRSGVHNVGDVMYDVAMFYRDKARENSTVMQRLNLISAKFALATCHRAENTDDSDRLEGILSALAQVAKQMPVVLPLHPRTRRLVVEYGFDRYLAELVITPPLPFLDMVALEQASSLILTDSGGVQKEAFFYAIPCITMRDETEWVETVDSGWNTLVGASRDSILAAVDAVQTRTVTANSPAPYGKGSAAEDILKIMTEADI